MAGLFFFVAQRIVPWAAGLVGDTVDYPKTQFH